MRSVITCTSRARLVVKTATATAMRAELIKRTVGGVGMGVGNAVAEIALDRPFIMGKVSSSFAT